MRSLGHRDEAVAGRWRQLTLGLDGSPLRTRVDGSIGQRHGAKNQCGDVLHRIGREGRGIFCGFPLADGQATIPAALLKEVKTRVGAGGGFIRIHAGDFKEFTGGGASYVIEVGHEDGTTFAVEDMAVTLD